MVVKIYVRKRCSRCCGSGITDCSACRGTGYNWSGGQCSYCGGIGTETCSECVGDGYIEEEEED